MCTCIQKTLNIHSSVVKWNCGNQKDSMKSCIFRYDLDFEPVKLPVGSWTIKTCITVLTKIFLT